MPKSTMIGTREGRRRFDVRHIKAILVEVGETHDSGFTITNEAIDVEGPTHLARKDVLREG